MNDTEELVCLCILVICMIFSFVMPILIIPAVFVVLMLIHDDYKNLKK